MKHEQRIGKAGEEMAAASLRRIGVHLVERIGTPVILIPAHEHAQKAPTYRVVFGEAVSGDHRGILIGGRSVLAETKTIFDRNLRWSDLRMHQPGRLDDHAAFGGLSILVWVHSTGVYPMRWPIKGFGAGKSISPEEAARLEMQSVDDDQAD